MAAPPEFLYPLQISVAVILAALMGTAMIVWFIKMWNVGGIAGNFFTCFFACIMMYAISSIFMVSASSAEAATFWGALAYIHGLTGWFVLFLAGEYSTSDRPPPMRVMIVGSCYGITMGGFISTLLKPAGSGLLYMSYVSGFGWITHFTQFFLLAVMISSILSLGLFLQFCHRAFHIAPGTRFGKNIRKLLVALSFGLVLDVLVIGMGMVFDDLAIYTPIGAMATTSGFQIIAFSLLFREYRIIYFMPHKAIGIIILTTEGVVCFDHMFEKVGGSNAIHDFLGPALTAVNNLVQETLELNAIEWVREFRTDKMTFLLDVKPQYDLIGVLVVSKATQLLTKSFGKFMESIMSLFENSGGELCDTPEKEKHMHEICAKAFPYIPPID